MGNFERQRSLGDRHLILFTLCFVLHPTSSESLNTFEEEFLKKSDLKKEKKNSDISIYVLIPAN